MFIFGTYFIVFGAYFVILGAIIIIFGGFFVPCYFIVFGGYYFVFGAYFVIIGVNSLSEAEITLSGSIFSASNLSTRVPKFNSRSIHEP